MPWRWPWAKPEQRASSYTDSIVEALLAAAEGKDASAATTAALEACAGLYAACFACARIEGAPAMVEGAISAACRATIARNLIRHGEDVHLVDTGMGLRLQPVGSWDVRGSENPDGWYVRCDLYGPSANRTVTVPHAAVVHTRYSIDSARPWQGAAPLVWAKSTGALAGRLEANMAAEAGAPPAQLVPVPADGGDGGESDPLADLKRDLGNAAGRLVLVETTQGAWGQGTGQAPRRDWEQRRIGAEWPTVLSETRRTVFGDVSRACNVPFALLDERAEGTSQREALRRFAHTAVAPLAELVAEELRDKLDAPALRFNLDPLMAADTAGKARAFKGFIEAGLTVEQAAAIVAVDV